MCTDVDVYFILQEKMFGCVLYLAVGNAIEKLIDLLWLIDLILSGGERVRGCQSINCKHTMDVIQNHQVFL